jgi:TolA-binding protein
MVLSLILLLASLGCQMPSSFSGSSTSTSTSSSSASSESEAERTRRIEAKAAEIERRAEEIRNMQGTEQEKIDAMNDLERQRRELMEMQESGGSSPY